MDRIQQAVSRAKEKRDASTSVSEQDGVGLSKDRIAPTKGGVDVGAIPTAVCDRDAIGRNRIIANEQDPALNAYRVLRTRTLQKMETNGWRTLAVVSAASGAGKTVTAINLAIAVGSKESSRSTLVDLDFYRPSVARYLGLDAPPSVLDFFEGYKSATDVTVKADVANMFVLPNERVSRHGAEHLTSPRMDHLIDVALNGYGSRIVIFDVSPLLGCDDAIALLPRVDCVLLVAASGHTRSKDVAEAKRLLKGVNLLGTVLNKAPQAISTNPYY
ncbi:MAG: CpsD/CapB family tyrosine-protein kinase [Pseudomonadota bacterium]